MAEDELRVRCEAVTADFAEDKELRAVILAPTTTRGGL